MGGAVFPPCCLTWAQTMMQVIKIMVTSFKRSYASTAALNSRDPEPGHCWPMPPLETPGHSRANLGQSFVGALLLCPGSWCAQAFICAPQQSVSPVLFQCWWLYGGVNGNLLQEGLCHTQACCTQSPCPCGRPLLTCTSAADTQTLKGRSGSVSVRSPGLPKVLFEPSKHLWWLWKVKRKWSCSVMFDSATPWTVAYQASLSMGFSRQKYWSRYSGWF